MIDSLIRKLEQRDRLTQDDRRILNDAVAEVRDYRAQQVVVPEGRDQNSCHILIDGMLARYKDLRDGRRQIVALHVPGDFADLHSLLLRRLEHTLAALSPVRVAVVPHAALIEIGDRHPRLNRMLWFSTQADAAIHREWILSIGRRSALGRLAHLFCELRARLAAVGMTDGRDYALPLTQIDLADATGLTPVHVNRMLRELRHMGALEFRSGRVRVVDSRQLEEIAEFDDAYLYLDRQPA